MIFDRIENANVYRNLHPRIQVALDCIQASAVHALEPGRFAIQGEQIYGIVEQYQTKPRAQGRWEAHRRYMDIQYVLSGIEVMGCTNVKALKMSDPYDAGKDIAWFSGDGDYLTVPAGAFTMFFPQDAHMPGLATSVTATVRKLVVKIEL